MLIPSISDIKDINNNNLIEIINNLDNKYNNTFLLLYLIKYQQIVIL